MSNREKLGIIGGMGPQATQLFYQFIINRTDALKDQEHISTIIASDTSIPDRTAMIKAGHGVDVYEKLLDNALMLEKCGCKVLAIPCNTSHYFIERLQRDVEARVVNMVHEAVAEVAMQGKKRPAILATDGVIESGMYKRECSAFNMTAVNPGPDIQRLVMKVIYEEIKAGEKGTRRTFQRIDKAIRSCGCDCAILACTELSVFAMYHHLSSFYIDAMMVLAEKVVTACGYPLRAI